DLSTSDLLFVSKIKFILSNSIINFSFIFNIYLLYHHLLNLSTLLFFIFIFINNKFIHNTFIFFFLLKSFVYSIFFLISLMLYNSNKNFSSIFLFYHYKFSVVFKEYVTFSISYINYTFILHGF